MEPFNPEVVRVSDLPRSLCPNLFKSAKEFSAAVDRSHTPTLAIAALLSDGEPLLEALAIANSSNEIFVLYCSRTSHLVGSIGDPTSNADALRPLFLSQQTTLVGFGMARIALHIRHGLNTHIRGVEITEAARPDERNLSPGAFVKRYVDPTANSFAVDMLWDTAPADFGNNFNRLQHLALRAWLTARVACSLESSLKQCVFADTVFLASKHFKPIHQMLQEVEKMEMAKSRFRENDFKGTAIDGNGNVIIANDRFSNRVRPSEQKEVWMVDEMDGLHRGTAKRATGKLTQVAPRSNLGDKTFKAIYVVGKDEFNHAERAREMFLLHLLQGKHDLRDSSYELIQELFFPDPRASPVQKVFGAARTGRLNQSQADVVEAMVNSEAPFVVVHGPPGTGKTSTISAAVKIWVGERDMVWIVAQSNVAVKNIAERLSRDDVRFRLIVSKEFYQEWHEHIYDEQVTQSIIRTDELAAHSSSNLASFYDIKVILCTLSTLSNPTLELKGIFSLVRVNNLVVDEASQIGIFNYMHIFAQFRRTLRKVCFFGDPKQLPPFGQDTASTIQSVFDLRQLKSQSYFLNIQYRMPVPLGSFISDSVYDGKLHSEHQIKAHSCVAFVDVSLGEEKCHKKSYINEREAQTIEHLVRHYYQHTDYCIITPYDAQRNLLQKILEDANLRSDNVYNVDSFQGNEADYIIVSVVRSTSPGFLVSQNRVNVMLTRCKLGMVIVTSRAFMKQWKVQNTLLGKKCLHWEKMHGREKTWRDWKDVAGKKADLPGVKGNTSSQPWDSSLVSKDAPLFDPLYPSLRNELDSPLWRKKPNSPPVIGMRPSVTSVVEDLRRTHLESRWPKPISSPVWSSSPMPSAFAASGSRMPYASNFPELPTSTRTQPVLSGSWRKGPPLSSRSASSTNAAPNFPSQKLSPWGNIFHTRNSGGA